MLAAAKLIVLNPNEFELWKMRIEQYFLMTDYAFREVILNGDSPPSTRSVEGVKTPYPPTTVKEKLARKNELKTRGTLLIALPNEHKLKFNSYKTAKSLMEAIERDLEVIRSPKKYRRLFSNSSMRTLMEQAQRDLIRVLSLEQINTNQEAKIEKLNKRVKKLEGKKKKRTHRLKRMYKGRIAEIDADENLSLINETAQDQGKMNEEDLFGVNDLEGDEVIVDVTIGDNVEQDATVAEKEVSTTDDEVVTTTEDVEGSSKRVRDKIDQESAKRQRLEKEDDIAELKRYLEIVLEDDDDVTIEATPLSSKSHTIVDYKIYKERKKSYFKIIRKMRIEQYFLMTDYALWEVILNGDLPPPTRSIEGVETPYPPTTTVKSLMEAIEKRFEVNTDHGDSAASSKTNASNLPNVDSLCDTVIYSFFASQSSNPQLGNEDLKQIDSDDLEEMDLKWQIEMLTIRARRFLQKTGRNLGVKGKRPLALTRQRNMEAPRRTVPVKDTTSNALVSYYDELGYDWSDQAKDGPTNFAFMAYTSSSSSSSSNSDTKVSIYSKACLKSYKTLKEHYDNLTKYFNKSQLNLGAYKAGLESVEAILEVYKNNEVVFEDDIKILKLDVMLRDKAITKLRQKYEKAKKERDDLKLTLKKFKDSSNNLSRLHPSSRAAVSVNTARPINTAYSRSTVNGAKPSSNVFHKSHLPVRRTFNQRTTPQNSDLKETVNTAKGNPQYTLQDQGIFDSGCSRHMTGNKSFLTDYQEIDGGFVAFGRSPKGGRGPEWLFDIDSLTNSMNYVPVTAGNQTYDNACIEINSLDDTDADEVPSKGDEWVIKGSEIDDQESLNINTVGSNYLNMPSLEETVIFDDVYDDREVGAEADINNLELLTVVSLIPTTRVHKHHPKEQIIRDLNLATQTRRMINFSKENAMTLVDVPNGKMAIRTKWVFKNKKDERGIVVRNKIDVKSAFLYGTIEEEVYVCQPLGFEDLYFPNKFWTSAKVKTVNEDVRLQALVDGKKVIVNEASIRRDLRLDDVEEIFVNPSLTKKVFANMKKVRTGFSGAITPLFETMMVQALEKWVKYQLILKTQPFLLNHYLLNPKVNTNQGGSKGSKQRVPSLEQINTNQAAKIERLKKRLKKPEGKKKKRTYGLKKNVQAEIDADENLSLINETAQDQGRMNEEDLFRVNDLDGGEVIVDVTTGDNVNQDATVAEKEVSTADDEVVYTTEDVEVTTAATTPQISKEDVTLAQTLIKIKAAKPKARGVIVQEPSKFRTTSSSHPSQLPHAKDKGKGIMVEPKKPLKKKYQIALDKEVVRKLEAQMKAKMEEEERIAMEKDEANIAVIEEWDDVQAIINTDRQLVEQLQTQEREQLSIGERSKLLAELIESRRKYFAAKRAEEIINKPPTKAQHKKIVEGSLKKTQAEVTEGSSKRAGVEIEQESAKRQRLEEEDDTAELKRCLEIVSEDDDDDDDVTIEVTPLSSKSPTIVDYKIYKERKRSYFKIIGRWKLTKLSYFGTIFKNFNIEDLEVLRSIVKERFKKTKPVNDMNNLLFQTLRTMFEHLVEDNIWKYQQGSHSKEIKFEVTLVRMYVVKMLLCRRNHSIYAVTSVATA
uniref:Reverse transcriptase Ty1/copia-type domain-containing protein n=1 Tax=Tanacetum cinerariifolium TaxID=118510 RepID=A0A699GR58_TANCI|nr:hypothetical protein [Tanacetum cinerariifolium]